MRASRRPFRAAPRTILAALIGAALLFCAPAPSSPEAWAQAPGDVPPEQLPPGEAAPMPESPTAPPEQPGPAPEQMEPAPEQPVVPSEVPVVPSEPEDGLPPRREHDRARDAVRDGQALPLGNIIRELQRTCPGTFLNAVLVERDGRLVYRLQTLSTGGRRLFTIVDAATGAVVSGGCR